MCLIRSIDSNMADLGLHITLLPISRQALPSSAATCQNQLLVLQIGLCLFLYVFPVFELLSVLFCSVPFSFLLYCFVLILFCFICFFVGFLFCFLSSSFVFFCLLLADGWLTAG